jgi:hypothetical protein
MRDIRTVMAAMILIVLTSAESVGQEGFFDFPLSVDGQTVQEFLSDEDRAAAVLSGLLEVDIRSDRARELLESIERGIVPLEEAPVALRGIGGFGALLVARAFVFKEAHQVQGRIRDYVYVDATKSGHLAVDVRTQFFASAEDRDSGKPPIGAELLHWDIDVDGAYVVHEREGPRDDPFPQVDLTLPGYAIASIWDPIRDLKYKLHAKGTGIVIRHVYRKVEGGTLELLPPEDPRYGPTDESCIDTLFNPYPPETELPPQRGFCLGRCAQPFIVNTGG